MIQLSLVVPCYNEEEVLPETARRLIALFDQLIQQQRITTASHIYFVDDGSHDATWSLITHLALTQPYIIGIKLAHNVGHQRALLSGLLSAEGDAVISIDADLQDDINAIEAMLAEFHQGNEIVYGVRTARETDTAFKRLTARGFYKLMRGMGIDIVDNHADYRLMGRRALEALRSFKEVHLFLRGVVPLLGFQTSRVYYTRHERFAGTSKYPLRRMISLALDGLTSFSSLPLRLVTVIGLLVFMGSGLLSCWVVGTLLLTDRAVPGWASTMLPICVIGGVQTLCLGILGEYIGKIYQEVKQRPRFIIESIVRKDDATPATEPSPGLQRGTRE